MQLKSSLISFNHHFDSPVIPTKTKVKVLIFQHLNLFYAQIITILFFTYCGIIYLLSGDERLAYQKMVSR